MGAWFDTLTMSLSNGADACDFTLTPALSLKGEGESKYSAVGYAWAVGYNGVVPGDFE